MSSSRSGYQIARDGRIRRHLHHAPGPTTIVLLTRNIAIIRVDEPKGGPRAELHAAVNRPHREPPAAGRIVEGEGGAVGRVSAAHCDRIHVSGHAPVVGERVLARGAGAPVVALHGERVPRIRNSPHLLRTWGRAVGGTLARQVANQRERGAAAG